MTCLKPLFRKTLSPTFKSQLSVAVACFYVSISPQTSSASEIIIPGTTIKQIITPETREQGYGADYATQNSVQWIPHSDLPDQKLILNLKQMITDGFINQQLDLKRKPWSGGFFPAWNGGIAGEWQLNPFINVMKTIFGSSGFKEKDAVEHAYASLANGDMSLLNSASATEKYDVMVSDYLYTASRIENETRGRRSGSGPLGLPATWAGYCNGVSTAGLLHEEPLRRVDVINAEGIRLSFYPNDIKALLALAYFDVDGYARVGNRCTKSSLAINSQRSDDADCRDVNPGSLVVALVNRLGRAGNSFIIDSERFAAISNHPVGSAKINIIKGPYTYDPSIYKYAAADTKYLADIEINMIIGSTSERDSEANIEDPASGEGFYKRVGFKGEQVSYKATLELDENSNIIGGEWTGSESEAPDFIWFGNMPATINAEKLKEIFNLKNDDLLYKVKNLSNQKCMLNENCDAIRVNPGFQWSIIKVIYDMSISTKQEVPLLDLRSDPFQVDHPERKIIIPFNPTSALYNLNITLLHSKMTQGANVLGYISGPGATKADGVKLFGLKNGSPYQHKLAEAPLRQGLSGNKEFLLQKVLSSGDYDSYLIMVSGKNQENNSIYIAETPIKID